MTPDNTARLGERGGYKRYKHDLKYCSEDVLLRLLEECEMYQGGTEILT